METTPQSMIVDPLLPTEAWAAATFGSCRLGDRRLVRRLVGTATKIAAAPDRSLCHALQSPAGAKGAYRFFRHPSATIPAITAPHRRQTLAAAGLATGPVLFVQDTSEADYSHHPKTEGLGPIGDGRGRGFLIQSVLAIQPGQTAASAAVLGLAHVEAFDRMPAPRKGETSAEIRRRPRESDCWMRATAAIGRPPAGRRWVLVGDRGADMYRLFVQAQELGQDLLVRGAYDRRAEDEAGGPTGVLRHARTVPPRGAPREIGVPATATQPARTARLAVGWAPILLRPPAGTTGMPSLPIWVIRVWEAAPPDGVAPVEWVLLSSVATATADEAWERVEWYRHRWIVEEYHQALKTGCRLEAAQVRAQAGLWALLGLCAPIAVRLLQLRMVARADPDAAAATVLDARTVAVVAALTATDAAGMTVGTCWLLVARLGGHQGRTHDGPPGWKTLWKGWSHVTTVLSGVHLAATLNPP
jgi:hypothetical protein